MGGHPKRPEKFFSSKNMGKVILINPFRPPHKKLPYTALFSHTRKLYHIYYASHVRNHCFSMWNLFWIEHSKFLVWKLSIFWWYQKTFCIMSLKSHIMVPLWEFPLFARGSRYWKQPPKSSVLCPLFNIDIHRDIAWSHITIFYLSLSSNTFVLMNHNV